MIGIINTLDAWTALQYPETDSFKTKLFGFCELANRSSKGKDNIGSQPLPMTINGTSDRQYVTLDDRYQLITWFRTATPIQLSNNIDGEDWAFGFDEGMAQSVSIRWVIAHRVELGEELILSFANAIPARMNISGYQVAFIDKTSVVIDPDHESIYRTELGDTVYEKHRFTWNIYTITFNAEYILNPNCVLDEGCCDDSFLTEAGDCFETEDDNCLITE